MTPEKLDIFLRTLTEHEKKYKEGWTNPGNEQSLEEARSVPKVKILRSQFAPASLSGGKHSRFSSYPAHIHPWVELNYMYSGSCIQKINGKEVTLKQGQTILLNQDTIHELPVLGENDILLNIYVGKDHLTSSFFNRFSQNNLVSRFLINAISSGLSHDSFLFFPSENRRRLSVFINEFFCEIYDPSECSQDVLTNLLALILTELMEVSRNESLQDSNPASSALYMLKYIEKNYKTATLTSTAEFFNLNPDYLSRILKTQTGCSFQTLLTRQRVLTAQQLLRNSAMPVAEVSMEVGYDNVTFFYKKFRSETGLAPGEYRKKYQG